jgi:hypothetical protein
MRFFNRDCLKQIPLDRSFFVETKVMTILFTNVNVYGFLKVGMKLFKVEMPVTRNSIREISLNIQDFTSVSLPTQCMMKAPFENRQCNDSTDPLSLPSRAR